MFRILRTLNLAARHIEGRGRVEISESAGLMPAALGVGVDFEEMM